MTPSGACSHRFHEETVASSNSAEAVTVFLRNEQQPSRAFSRGFRERAAELQNGHVTRFLWNGRIAEGAMTLKQSIGV